MNRSCAIAVFADLRQYGIVASMSLLATAMTNAVGESFFGTRKAELVGDSV
jgi:transposase InsO family protein